MGKFSEQKMAKLDGRGEGPKTKEKFLKRYQGLTDALFDNAKILDFVILSCTKLSRRSMVFIHMIACKI